MTRQKVVNREKVDRFYFAMPEYRGHNPFVPSLIVIKYKNNLGISIIRCTNETLMLILFAS